MHVWKNTDVNGQFLHDWRTGKSHKKIYSVAIFGRVIRHNLKWLHKLLHRIEYGVVK